MKDEQLKQKVKEFLDQQEDITPLQKQRAIRNYKAFTKYMFIHAYGG